MTDKKRIVPLIVLPLLSLVSCGNQEMIDTIQVPSIYAGSGEIRVIGSDFVSPFDTSITGSLYYHSSDYTEEQIKDIEDTFKNDFTLYHALSDRHYSYYQGNDETALLNNIKTINDSYGEEKEILLHPFLYDLLKTSYDFMINSDGKFNIFLGTLNDIYEEKLGEVREEKNKKTLDAVLQYSTDLIFSSFNDEEKNRIDTIVKTIPTTKQEMENILTFDDTKKSVIFHRYEKADKLKISLGGNAKGFATEYIADSLKEKYPNISFLINSGFSSIKAIGTRPDKKAWKIRYDNPSYYEKALSRENPYYRNEVKIEIDGDFDLSTSGYYNQYFYEYDDSSSQFLRRMHILNGKTGYSSSFFDQVSVLINDSALADMYTTALMNTDSVEEATSLFAKLNSIYQIENPSLMLCYKTKKDSSSPFSYSLADYDTLSSSHLPISVLNDNSEYTGDYSSLPMSEIKEIKSKYQPEFMETYSVSENLFDKASLMSEKEIGQKGKTKLAKIEKLAF